MNALRLLALALATASSALVASEANVTVIDSFDAGTSFTLNNTSGTAAYNAISGASGILGGNRQLRSRAAGSGFYGPSTLAINVTAGTLSSYGTDSNDRYAQYGSAIGSQTFTGAGPGTPVNLNLNLNLADAFQFDVSHVSTTNPASNSVTIEVLSGAGGTFTVSVPVTATGTYTVELSDIAGLTELKADDIDGLLFGFFANTATLADALVVNELRIVTASAVPEPSSFAALAGLAVLGLVATRRRRTAD